MKNSIFKWIAMFTVCVSIYSCGLFRRTPKPTDTTLGTPAMYGQTFMYNSRQVDSMCLADAISPDLENNWLSTQFVDDETGAAIRRYVFIKIMNDDEEMTYILTPVDTLYKVTKRYVKNVEEDD
jgi:hypothetical protein